MTRPSAEDIAAMRKQGDLSDYLRSVIASVPAPVKPRPSLTAVESPGYRIAHVGGWPLGTAATGPTPPPDMCTCAKCGGNPASRAAHRTEGEAA